MKITYDYNFDDNFFLMNAFYNIDEVRQNYFYINRDFKIREFTIDGKDAIDDLLFETDIMFDIEVAKVILPRIRGSLFISYVGKLSGKTGIAPYVRETINDRFTMLRWETICFPIFCKNEEYLIFEYINDFCDEVAVITPEGYKIGTPAELIVVENSNNKTIHKFKANRVDFAISKYTEVNTKVGDYYIQKNYVNHLDRIIKMVLYTHGFMTNNFGEQNIDSNLKYVSIPNGYGSFVVDNCIFFEEGSITNNNREDEFIHEYIHLGWNVKVDAMTQRIRFFDEAFTQYFVLRVLKSIDHNRYILKKKMYVDSYRKQIVANESLFMPISEFGKNEVGGLSYSIGALVLEELSIKLEEVNYDLITKDFIRDYKNREATMKIFCDYYSNHQKGSDLAEFFDEWIWSTKGLEKYKY